MSNPKAPSDRTYELIDCKVCNIKIQNETTYKIHLTTPQHLKKEDSLVACGKIPKLPRVTQWENLNEYLDYLRLDEPFIGLQHVIEVDPLKYLCRLCFYEADMPSIVLHLVGRKHRQKYLETSRPDLVVWDVNTPSQLGKTIKAQAEIVERQEGRGIIELTKKKNIAPVDQKGKGFLKAWQGKIRKSRWDTPGDSSEPVGNFLDQLKALTGNVLSSNPASRTEFSRGGRYPEDDSRGRYPEDDSRGRYPEDDSRGRYPGDNSRGRYPEDDSRGRYPEDDSRGRYPEDDSRGRYPEDDSRGRYPEDDSRGRYPEDDSRGRYPEDDSRGRYPEDDSRGRYPEDDSRGRYPEDDSRGRYPEDDSRGRYPEDDSRGRYPEDDSRGRHPKDDFSGRYPGDNLRGRYPEDDLRGRYPKDDLRGSYVKEDLHGSFSSGDGLGRRFLKDGFSGDSTGKRQLEDDPDRRRIPEGGLGRNKMFENLPEVKIRDYDSGRKLYDDDDGQGRIPHDVPERQLVEGDRERRDSAGGWGRPLTQSGAGERHFEGGVGGRKLPAVYHADKTASRLHGDRPHGGYPENRPSAGFSEERARGRFPDGGLSRGSNADSLVRSYPEDPSTGAFPADGRTERTDFETFSNKRLRMDPMVPKQDDYLQDGYSRAQTVVNPGDFLNSMGSIEMQSPEEATFLREKLCDILKEFQAKKAQGETLNPVVPQPTIFKDYNHMKMDTGMPGRDGYQAGGGDFGSDPKPAGRRSSDRSLYPLPAERWPSDRPQYPLSSQGRDPPNAGRFSDGPVYHPPSSLGAFPFPGASSTYQSSGDKAGYATERERLSEAPLHSFNRGGPADRGAPTSSDKLTATLLQVFSRGFK
ncbi:uncharacterized protein si:ch211-13c6.2 isoform X2 [Polyodon spathula]|uniref:uncharacterized protein si:ch211-13c6.2 isoform X2 n=1 Tax=Polyodon spathula TaxID=7913 RepID=UPI001B7F6B9F|nr:uncharacterized protein si:ch211-13c6.2 isoform X2 [Polyodon spathula]